jgi:hypothetical protein
MKPKKRANNFGNKWFFSCSRSLSQTFRNIMHAFASWTTPDHLVVIDDNEDLWSVSWKRVFSIFKLMTTSWFFFLFNKIRNSKQKDTAVKVSLIICPYLSSDLTLLVSLSASKVYHECACQNARACSRSWKLGFIFTGNVCTNWNLCIYFTTFVQTGIYVSRFFHNLFLCNTESCRHITCSYTWCMSVTQHCW